jgi:hypothetical protein
MQNAADLVTAELLQFALQLQGLGKVTHSILVETALDEVAFKTLHAEQPNQVRAAAAAAAAAAVLVAAALAVALVAAEQ